MRRKIAHEPSSMFRDKSQYLLGSRPPFWVTLKRILETDSVHQLVTDVEDLIAFVQDVACTTVEPPLSLQHLLRSSGLRRQLTVNSHQLERQDVVWLHDQDALGVHAFLH